MESSGNRTPSTNKTGETHSSGAGVSATAKNITYEMADSAEQSSKSVSLSSVSVHVDPSPLPSAEILQEYQKLIPDAPERFMRLVENEQKHRFETENSITATNNDIARGKIRYIGRGQTLGFIMALVILGLGTLFVFTGHDVMAYILYALCLVAVIVAFIGKSNNEVKNLK